VWWTESRQQSRMSHLFPGSDPFSGSYYKGKIVMGRPSRIVLASCFVPLVLHGLLWQSAARANCGFMPGDAFFHSELTSDVLKDVASEKDHLILNYAHVPLSGGFGGYAGFERIKLTNLPEPMRLGLRGIYASLRQNCPMVVRIDHDKAGNNVLTEINGFHLFVYNRDVNWHKQRIGIKYNERWMAPPVQATTATASRPSGFGRAPSKEYTSFVFNRDGIVEDWKNARVFGELKVTIPERIPWGLTGPKIMEPVLADAKQIQIVVLAGTDGDSVDEYFSKTRGVEFFTITADGVKRFVWAETGLVGEDYKEGTGAKKGVPDQRNLTTEDAEKRTRQNEGTSRSK
jgi:hypothetical protein